MDIEIFGAREHNLKNIDICFGDGLTVVTGVSGSGKTSLIFDTLYHEARRRFLDVYLYGRGGQRLAPAQVEKITGLVPTIAVGQNLLNRNPSSILATASGLHPFLRLLYTHFGQRRCLVCGRAINLLKEDEIIEQLLHLVKQETLHLYAPLIQDQLGSHKTLLSLLVTEFRDDHLVVDGKAWTQKPLDPTQPHSIEIKFSIIDHKIATPILRETIQKGISLGAGVIHACGETIDLILSKNRTCTHCGASLGELRATYFNQKCPYCKGKGCQRCDQTGMHPQAASIWWQKMRLSEFLALSVNEAQNIFSKTELPSTADRLSTEIMRRLIALNQLGLGYLTLNRSAQTLSRGESQRVRLAISLSSRLEDLLHVLDEPTIGLHPTDVTRFLPAFRKLSGPVIYIEHDRIAAAAADWAVDLGPGAGVDGGEVVFEGKPIELWQVDTATGRYFSRRDSVISLTPRPPASSYLSILGARKHNLHNIDINIPLERLTVITGVSGSGKSTLVEHVLVPSLLKKKPIGCTKIGSPKIKPVLVDQSPIGRNPRSNPATYTKLADLIRDTFAEATGLSKSHFSFNRPEGACPACKGIGATEIKMRYLPSIWLPCVACDGKRFNTEVLNTFVDFNGQKKSIADFYATPIREINDLIAETSWLTPARRNSMQRILEALNDVGLGYLELGQPSPALSGGESQRVKLTKYLGKPILNDKLLILDEPSTGLHSQDLDGLLNVLNRLVRHGATVIIVEHNLDFIRAADWVIDLGPGAGPEGGRILYQGQPCGLVEVIGSQTGRALLKDEDLSPPQHKLATQSESPPQIKIRNARANNLKAVNVDIPKGKLTVITGVSGSGKSSLIGDVLQAEARRRYLESLSMYERQGLRESAEAAVDSITGLGVTLTVAPQQAHTWSQIPQFTRRNSVGTITEISFHLGNLLAALGERDCLICGNKMRREEEWTCPHCAATAPIAQPRHFSSTHWSSTCKKCNGIGTIFLPDPTKLIIHPDKPLCAGAMYSPGYWPQTYLCKDQPILNEIGKNYNFDPLETPWNEMSSQAQHAFLFGDGKQYTWTYTSKAGRTKGQEKQSTWTWRGFYGEDSWVYDWDVHGTYTRQMPCPDCGGAGLRQPYLTVTLQGKNIFELSEMPLHKLELLLSKAVLPKSRTSLVETSLEVILTRLRFLRQVGIGYLTLNRPTGTLSAGEAQRIQLASLLGSRLTALTILVDEPSRGMHPCELKALRDALLEIRDQGNSIIIVEHDPLLIRAADHIIDMGPGAGTMGGEIVAQGSPVEIIQAQTKTGKWLENDRSFIPGNRRRIQDWMIVRGARENNLHGEDIAFPLGVFTGVCGVSGSGKSTLLLDTLGRALVKKTHTSSFAREPLQPGDHDTIENAPKRTFLVDQTRREISSPAKFLGLDNLVLKQYANSDDALALGLSEKMLRAQCSSCRGQGLIRMDMGFLPDEWVECEICHGTGCCPEAWEVNINGVAFPELNNLTLDEVYQLFKTEENIATRLEIINQVGLGYLVWKQPAYTLSGGEAQRLKIAKELIKRTRLKTLYIFDEPTVGLHLDDVSLLVKVINRLVDYGHTVIAIEHHLHLLAACDWLIELGPVGGPDGGHIIATGKPEEVAKLSTPTAPYLQTLLKGTP